MSEVGSDRNLLYGLLAWQNGLIDEQQLLDGLRSWSFDKQTPLGEHLVRLQFVSRSLHERLDRMVDDHVALFDGKPARSLAGLTSANGLSVQIRNLIADPELHESLSHLPLATDIVPGPAADSIPETMPWSVEDVRREAGRFEIVREHASGGLGCVSLAIDRELNREVALKEIRAELSDDDLSQERFLREAEITGNLEHPGIVPVYAMGRHDDGRPYYVMRFVRGDSLKRSIQDFHDSQAGRSQADSNLLFRELLQRLIDVCNAVAYAHSRGVLHRDLKPDNILMGRYGETLVVDWGLARLRSTPLSEIEAGDHTTEPPIQPRAGSDSSATRLGDALGTPAYMSPEQAAGQHDDLGPETDVYSLGATLYHLLTGQPPFRRSADPESVLGRVQRGDFERPRNVRAEVPGPLASICLKAMSKSPSARYSGPAELGADLERWLADEKVQAHREGLVEASRRLVRSHQTIAATTGIALLIGVASFGWSNRQLLDINKELRSTNTALGKAEKRISAEKTRLAAANVQLQRKQWKEQLAAIRAALRSGNYEEVLQHTAELDPAVVTDPILYEQLIERGEALIGLNRAVDGLQLFASLPEAPNSRLHARRTLVEGDALLFGEPDRAKETIRNALDLGELSEWESNYARALLASTLIESREHFQSAVLANPLHLRSQALLAMTSLLCGDRTAARQTCEFGLHVWPAQIEFQIVLFVIESFEGNLDAAAALHESLLAQIPQEGTALATLVEAFSLIRRQLEGEEISMLANMTVATKLYACLKALQSTEREPHLPPILASLNDDSGVPLFGPNPIQKLYDSTGNSLFLFLVAMQEPDPEETKRILLSIRDEESMVPGVRQFALGMVLQMHVQSGSPVTRGDPNYLAALELANAESIAPAAIDNVFRVLTQSNDWKSAETFLRKHQPDPIRRDRALLDLYWQSEQYGRFLDHSRTTNLARQTPWADRRKHALARLTEAAP